MDLPFTGISRDTLGSEDSAAASAALSLLHKSLRLPGAAHQAAGRRWLQSQPYFRICPESGSAALAPPPHLQGHRWSRCWGGRLEDLDLGTDDSQIGQRDGGFLYRASMYLFLVQESGPSFIAMQLSVSAVIAATGKPEDQCWF